MVGVKEDDIYHNAKVLLTDKGEYDKMAKSANPYGDGQASKRIVQVILDWGYNRK